MGNHSAIITRKTGNLENSETKQAEEGDGVEWTEDDEGRKTGTSGTKR